MVLALSVACGSADDSSYSGGAAEPAGEVDETLSEVSRIMMADRTFTADEYVAAGWKRSKQFDDISTVPGATEVYFGFYNARDIELRIYASHNSAVSVGAVDATEDIDVSKGWAARPGAGRGTTKFKAFAVVGNTVILCELSIDVCVELVNALDG